MLQIETFLNEDLIFKFDKEKRKGLTKVGIRLN